MTPSPPSRFCDHPLFGPHLTSISSRRKSKPLLPWLGLVSPSETCRGAAGASLARFSPCNHEVCITMVHTSGAGGWSRSLGSGVETGIWATSTSTPSSARPGFWQHGQRKEVLLEQNQLEELIQRAGLPQPCLLLPVQ